MVNPNTDKPVLEFDHNVIEHLGIKLYANKPTNVLAELVSNCWDADAENVWVSLGGDKLGQFIAVSDDGSGMSLRDIRDKYLVVGKQKRRSPKEVTSNGRAPMGRKGIGKLAPFGIARDIDVITLSGGKINWFKLSLDGINQTGREAGAYFPPFLEYDTPARDVNISNFPTQLSDELNSIFKKGHGTAILMSGLTGNSTLDTNSLAAAIGRRFSVILLRKDFNVYVNGIEIDEALAVPRFEFRIPKDAGAYNTELLNGQEVRYWAGFVKTADWPSEEAGVGVYTHGKIAQDRPFFFRTKGKEVFQRYLYAVVEAEWIDEQEHDLVSTDRTSLDWKHPDLAPLMEWGAKKVSNWLDAYTKIRIENQVVEIAETAERKRKDNELPIFTELENKAVEALVAEATQQLGRGERAEQAREEMLSAVSLAWMNVPSRRLIKQLWATVGDTLPAEKFTALLKSLRGHSVPESMGLALTFAQRAYALSLLDARIHNKSEVALQKLVEEFPWILDPQGDLLTADRQLKTTLEAAAESDKSNDRPGRVIRGMTAQERADFVFLRSADTREIRIIEIKGPNVLLNRDIERQLMDYIDYTRTFHGAATVKGILVGNPGSPRYVPDSKSIIVKGWDEVFLECRASYIEMLASMIEYADISNNDSRFKMVREFGGPEVWELLKRFSEKDDRLKALFDQLPVEI